MSSRIQNPSCRGCRVPGAGITPTPHLPDPVPCFPLSAAGGQAEAGWCCWFSSAHFPVAMTTHQKKNIKSYITKHHSTMTGGVCHTSLWLGLDVLAMVSSAPVVGLTHSTLPKASLGARDRAGSLCS